MNPDLAHAAQATQAPDNFVDLMLAQAARHGHKTAFVFLEDGETPSETLSYVELSQRAQATAAHLQQRCLPGSRVLLLYPSCVDYMVGFFGCLSAGMVAVPVFPPRSSKHNDRLEAIARDSGAHVALTTADQLQQMQPALQASPLLSALDILCTDRIAPDDAAGWHHPVVSAATLAFLQYTSGSTGQPKGVMVTHGNLLHNEVMIQASFHSSERTVYVTWLPIYHDMGLIGNMLHAYWLGGTCYFMAPVSFLQRPARWLQAISRYRATISGGPDFAYRLCIDKISPEVRRELDLSSWQIAFNGAEPVRHETLQRFSALFAESGFQHRAWLPCYGMAESTLIATGGSPLVDPIGLHVDRDALGQRRVVRLADGHTGSVPVVGCGGDLPGQTVRIVDPATLTHCAPDQIGEIWLAGPHIGQGYWQKPEASEATFRARIVGLEHEGPFLRTGDLGFVQDGELYVAGRLKDVIIVRGVNHYPQDIEASVEAANEAMQPAGAAAFSIDDGGGERVVVVAEVQRTALRRIDPVRLVAQLRQRILEKHELVLSDLVLIRPGTLPKTSSGKVQRSRTRQLYQSDALSLLNSPATVEG
jgi:acyl-CoA synthetase (AMP-forming)/AMP-acid ligase II